MSKTFKANPTNDKHNLKKRILEIESNPTTTTSSTVTKITSDDVGDGLVITEDTKLNLNLGDGLKIDGAKKIQVDVGDGLEIGSGVVKIKTNGSTLQSTASGLKKAGGQVSHYELRSDIYDNSMKG